MTDELTSLFEDIQQAVDKASMCCGCNMFAVDNAVEALRDYLTANPECNNTYHGKEGFDCCN